MFAPSKATFARCTDTQSIVDSTLNQSLALSGACLGNVQLMNWKAHCLEIEAQHGFDDEFLNFFRWVYIDDASACARALQRREAIVIEDVNTDLQFAPCRAILERAGI